MPPPSQSTHASAQSRSARSASASDSVAEGSTTSSRSRWSSQHEYDFIKMIKDNVEYQAALLPGHKKKVDEEDKEAPSTKMSNASILRAISASIFRKADQKTAPQIRQKLISIIENYNKLLKTETKTGQGMLASEMTAGSSIKTFRESIVERHPWYEILHEMMLDRSPSDPAILVTGAGERRTSLDEDITGDNKVDDERLSSEAEEDDDGALSPYSRNHGLGIFDHDDYTVDFGDNDDLDARIDPQLRLSTTSTDLSRSTTSARRGSSIVISDRGSSTSLPLLAGLARASSRDRQRQGAVGASSNGTFGERNHNPPPSSAGTSSRVKSDKTGRSQTSKGKNRQVDAYVDKFARTVEDDKRLQLEREETKRRRLDVRSQQIQLQSQEGERQNDLVNTQFSALMSRVDALQISVTARLDGFEGMLGGIMAKIDTVASKLDALSAHSP
ncbi:hypothetical protein V8E36_006828 [Tilletia maclaganii]